MEFWFGLLLGIILAMVVRAAFRRLIKEPEDKDPADWWKSKDWKPGD